MSLSTSTAHLTGEALDALQEGVLLSDADGLVVDANVAACRILGLSADDVIGWPVAALAHEPVDVRGEPLTEREHPSERTSRTGRECTAVVGLRRAGRRLWLHMSSTPSLPPGSTPVPRGSRLPVLTTFVDITAQMLQRQALQTMEERFRRTFQDAPIGMAVVGLDGRFVQVNRALTQILDRSEEELLGLTPDAIVFPEDSERSRAHLLALEAGEVSSYQVDKRFVRGGGEPVWTRVTVSLVRDRDGVPVHYVKQVEDVSEVRRAHALLERRALYDHLTGLANRSLLLDRLSHALSVADRRGSLVAVVFMDLDHFKRINDSLGHDAGDRLLQEVASRMQSAVRPADTVARLGGDEFVLVLEGVNSVDDAGHALQRVLDTVQHPVAVGDHEVVPSVSAGLTVSDGKRTADQVLGDADTALYVAKDRGRSRWEVYDDAYRMQALQRLEVEQDLRSSIARRELELHYQPVVDLRSGHVVGLEALVRWRHPRRGLLLPAEFIDVCEDAHLMPALGAWVLREACEALARHPEFDGQVFVNVSPRQIGRADLSRVVSDALTGTGIGAHRLGLEITESGVLKATGSSRVDLERIAAMGVTVLLDDFGTGYSALSSVLSAPVDGLKLDRSFTARLGDDGAADRISVAVAALADSLHGYGVVEGVETQEQRDHAIAHGWTHGQGWLFGRPLPEAEVFARIARGSTALAGAPDDAGS
jgi:diguanylate cyclase (GGDEF)-like protein/PAS domain S-box-containing protein